MSLKEEKEDDADKSIDMHAFMSEIEQSHSLDLLRVQPFWAGLHMYAYILFAKSDQHMWEPQLSSSLTACKEKSSETGGGRPRESFLHYFCKNEFYFCRSIVLNLCQWKSVSSLLVFNNPVWVWTKLET